VVNFSFTFIKHRACSKPAMTNVARDPHAA